jgi:hypothetical protein
MTADIVSIRKQATNSKKPNAVLEGERASVREIVLNAIRIFLLLAILAPVGYFAERWIERYRDRPLARTTRRLERVARSRPARPHRRFHPPCGLASWSQKSLQSVGFERTDYSLRENPRFNPRPPRGGATLLALGLSLLHFVSIHAPA